MKLVILNISDESRVADLLHAIIPAVGEDFVITDDQGDPIEDSVQEGIYRQLVSKAT